MRKIKYRVILTKLGYKKIGNAIENVSKVNLSQFIYSDEDIDLDESLEHLPNIVYQNYITNKTHKSEKEIVLESVIPIKDGGFTINSIGVVDTRNDLIMIGKVPSTYIPTPSEGSTKELVVQMVVRVDSADKIEVIVDPSVTLVTQTKLEEKLVELLSLLDNKVEYSELDDAIEELIGEAPEVLDTLQELADALDNDPNFATTVMKELSKKVDKEPGKGLSSNDFTNEFKAKLELLKHTTKISDLEQDIDYALKNDLKPLRVDIDKNTSLINSEVARIIGIIDGLEIPEEVDLTPIYTQLKSLEDKKLNKIEFEDRVSTILTEIQEYLDTELSIINEKIENKADKTDIPKLLSQLEDDINLENRLTSLELTRATKVELKQVEEELIALVNGIDIPEVNLQPIETELKRLDTVKANKTDVSEALEETIGIIGQHLANQMAEVNTALEDKANTDDLAKLEKAKADLTYVTNEVSRLETLIIENKVDLTGYAKKTDIPTKLGQLENDKKYITLSEVPKAPVLSVNNKKGHVELTGKDIPILETGTENISDLALGNKAVLQGLANELPKKANKTDIPTRVGQLENDKGYITLAEIPKIDLTPYLRKDGEDNEFTLGKGNMFESNFKNDNWSFINNYTGGGWARGLLNIKNKEGDNYLQIGGNGGGQNFTRLYIGKAWNDWNLSVNPNAKLVEVQDRLTVKGKDVAIRDDIPTKVSQLSNDKGYITKAEVPGVDLSEIKGSIANLEKNKADKEHNHSQYVAKTGDSMTGSLSVTTPGFPVARFERATTATGNRYGAINLVRSGAIPVDGIGIGFYFKNNNKAGNETHSGFFGGALDRVATGNEVGQLVFAPAYRGQDPFARTDFTLTALNNSESVANFKGQLKLNDNDVALKKDTPTHLSHLTDNSSSIPIKYSERVRIFDTRNTEETPLEVMRSGPASLKFDFKHRGKVGNPDVDISANGSYAHILTVYGWTDSSGGYPTQISFGQDKVGIRTGTSNTNWSPWRKYSDDEALRKIVSTIKDQTTSNEYEFIVDEGKPYLKVTK